mgnify:CR=1 FL=1
MHNGASFSHVVSRTPEPMAAVSVLLVEKEAASADATGEEASPFPLSHAPKAERLPCLPVPVWRAAVQARLRVASAP